jgi:hypothetical protein
MIKGAGKHRLASGHLHGHAGRIAIGAAPIDWFSARKTSIYVLKQRLEVPQAIDRVGLAWWSRMQASLNSCAVQSNVSE